MVNVRRGFCVESCLDNVRLIADEESLSRKVALMNRKRTGSDVHIGDREITLGDLRLELGGLQGYRKAKVWECIMVFF